MVRVRAVNLAGASPFSAWRLFRTAPRLPARVELPAGAVAAVLLLVAIVIFVPQTVTIFLDKEVAVDLDKVQIDGISLPIALGLLLVAVEIFFFPGVVAVAVVGVCSAPRQAAAAASMPMGACSRN